MFKKTSHLTSFGSFLLKGGRPAAHLKVIYEATLRTHHKAIIVSFTERFTNYNTLNMCRIADNLATIKLDDGTLVERVPFSMLYLDTEQTD